jgi:hypothetical protein
MVIPVVLFDDESSPFQFLRAEKAVAEDSKKTSSRKKPSTTRKTPSRKQPSTTSRAAKKSVFFVPFCAFRPSIVFVLVVPLLSFKKETEKKKEETAEETKEEKGTSFRCASFSLFHFSLRSGICKCSDKREKGTHDEGCPALGLS